MTLHPLTARRLDAGIPTVAELARRAGVNARTVADIEAGRRKPHGGTLLQLAAALGIEPSVLAAEVADYQKAAA